MEKITVGGTEANPTYTKSKMSTADALVMGATASLGIISNDATVFYDKKSVGVAAAINLAAGIFVGDKWGQSIPVLGGRR